MSTSNVIRPGGRSRPGRMLALLTATAVAASLLSVPSGSTPAAGSPPTATAPDVASGLLPGDAKPVAVTLITGDTVYWYDTGDGNPRLDIEAAPREHPAEFDRSGTSEDFYVIPTDVMDQVVAGAVDDELFNIPGLIRQGLDDASTDQLPVIVTFDRDRGAGQLARDTDALPATSNVQAVDSLNGAGATVDRDDATTFRQTVLGEPGQDSQDGSRIAGARGLDGAVDQILLDRVLQIDLADSVPQIGAPDAWGAGVIGEGVTVAVLDTGVDAGHPDLAGQVLAAENFTPDPDATDRHGHGTHVASTIAGTGAASGGSRTGVAPGADLLSGKVCNAAGQCQTSWIMAGMQWATQQGADIVNMSLGGGPTDGRDPLAQLLNQLSAQTGTLFVTSAGNTGSGLRVVGSPGAADAALTVGAVDKADRRATFSSRGPRLGDHAVKPEITAPGVGIVAARAAGTTAGTPVDDRYTSLNGTSMASPHVAGTAALLAQARPDLDGAALKDALVSTAADGGLRWYEQGTGRVDVPAVLDSPVYATGTVNLGGIRDNTGRDITYTNQTDTDLTLTLQASATNLNGQPAGGVSVSANAVTVPARGTASVTVTVTPDQSTGDAQQSFGGVVTATGPGVSLRTAIGFGPPLHQVTIEVLDSNGNRIGTDTAPDRFVWLTHDTLGQAAGGTTVHTLRTDAGIAVGHVPPGTYSVLTVVEEQPATNPLETTRESTLIELELGLEADTSVILDARDAVLVEQPTVPRKVHKRNLAVSVVREFPGTMGSFTILGIGASAPAFVTPTPRGALAPLALLAAWTLAEPQQLQPIPREQRCPRLPYTCFSETPAYVYNLPILYENGIPDDLRERITRRDLVEVPTRFHAEHADALAKQEFMPRLRVGAVGNFIEERIFFRPGRVTEFFLADDRIGWNRLARVTRTPDGGSELGANLFSDDWFPTAEGGARRAEERWHAGPMRMGMWDVRDETLSWPGTIEVHTASGSRGGRDGNQFVVPSYLMDDSGHGGEHAAGASRRMWNLDAGAELTPAGLTFPLSPGAARYRLEQVENYSPRVAGAFRTGPAVTTWTFTSRPSAALVPPRYQCPLRSSPSQPPEPWSSVCQFQPLILLHYQLDLDIQNQARAGRAHMLTVLAGHHSKAVDHAPVTSMTVQASFDDSATWQDARVVVGPRDTRETGGLLPAAEPRQRFQVLLRVPALSQTTGFVTLRVQAEDANGGTIDQTINRAYILK